MLRKRRYHRSPLLLAKRDLRAAFKLAPLSISMLSHAGLRFGRPVMMYLSLYLGWKGAPGKWGIISTLTLQYIEKHPPATPDDNGPVSFGAFQFGGDGGFRNLP